MKPIREWMGDRRVAAALAALAFLFVGYRVVKSYRPSPLPPVAAEAPTQPSTGPVEGVPSPAGPPSTPASAPIPPNWSGPSWAWDRNPFLPPAVEHSRGVKGAAPPAAGEKGPGGAAAPGDGPLPELRGTVVGREGAMAIFANRLVPAGGAIGGWTLVGVQPYRVVLRRGKETRVLELYKQ